MKQLLCQLPKPNYATLKFVIAFLVLISQQEEVNKMNAMALSIVFGSVLFRLVISISYQLLDTVTGFYVSAHRIDGARDFMFQVVLLVI